MSPHSKCWTVLVSLIFLSSIFLSSLPAFSAEPAAPVTLEDFKLVGDLNDGRAGFTLTATARVEDSKGASLELLSGTVALTDIGPHPKWQLRAEPNRYIAVFDRKGKYPIQLKFDVAVRPRETWKGVEFHVAPGVLQRVVLKGLAAETQFEFPGAARPERKDSDFVSYLPADGSIKLSWKETRPETEGKLFYSAEMHSQISVSPGLMRQAALLDFKVMQGELSRVTLILKGAGEVTRVQGEQVLSWSVESPIQEKLQTPKSKPQESSKLQAPSSKIQAADERRLVIQFNQPQKDQFSLQVYTQTPLGAFPQTADALQVRPEGATRFAGYFRIVNDGAVRLEVSQASGLSQISPEQFPETDATKAALRITGSQKFAYRFSGADFALRISADQILPELTVSQLLAYHLGENELTLDAEIELDIREAPLRELLVRVPKGYVLAQPNASGMSDYFLRGGGETAEEPADGKPEAELRLIYGQPLTGRQIVQLHLERNKPLAGTSWVLPRIEVVRAKSVRGHLGVAADAGFRLTPERVQSLTEIATAFFPRKVNGLQAAFRLSDPAWLATMRVERLPQTVQADVFHLFSIAEGIAYGSSVINYVISGAPVSTFKVELPEDFVNAEFTGKDVRNWESKAAVPPAPGQARRPSYYLVHLHTPVSGPYTLLATYERAFKPHGETLSFTGARPLEVQADQGYTLVVSAYQFQMTPTEVSPGLLQLEPAEVPPEYRLFFDAPILAAYRYTSRPFNLKLAVSPLAQGDSLSQVVDRASITNHISKEGQVLTDVRYFLKNRGNPNFRITLPSGTQLWSASVNGASVVPVIDGNASLIPLPQRADPNAVLTVDLKLAGRSDQASRVKLAAPILAAPVMLAEWMVEPDTGQRLVYRAGSLTPAGGVADVSGFAQLARAFSGTEGGRAWVCLLAVVAFLGSAVVLWRWALGQRSEIRDQRSGAPGEDTGPARSAPIGFRVTLGTLGGAIALVLATIAFYNLTGLVADQRSELPRNLSFLIPVQQPGTDLQIEVGNQPGHLTVLEALGYLWPLLLLAILAAAARFSRASASVGASRSWAWVAALTILAWVILRFPNAAVVFLIATFILILAQVILPALRDLWRNWRTPHPARPAAATGGLAPATTALLLGGALLMAFSSNSHAHDPRETQHATRTTSEPRPAPLPDSVLSELRIEEKFALGTTKITWQAEKGQKLPLLFDPAVLTRVSYPSNALELISQSRDREGAPLPVAIHALEAKRPEAFTITVQYELQVSKKDGETGLTLPVPYGLVNQVSLTVANADVDVLSPQAVSVQREIASTNTTARVVLPPVANAWIAWKPRSRDVKHEKPVFYAEISHLYAPTAGVIEGAHIVSIRPAQGELSELVLDVPRGATVTDVADRSDSKNPCVISLWRFDPDAHKLRVTFNSPQSRPFALLVRSQVATGPLPFEQTVGLISVANAAGQVGSLGIATGSEVELDGVTAPAFSPINLEDFPPEPASALQGQIPGLAVRRAFRYTSKVGEPRTLSGLAGAGETPALLCSLKASAVEPDIRVETQDTLSLGEDRTVLADNAIVKITRAGIFRLSFLMPEGFDVESISGPALSHWTESKSDSGHVITMHLQGKTEGQQQFSINLAGPGIKTAKSWAVPQLSLREASKQTGTLLVVPEQGMRLQATTRESVSQLDPQRSGIRQKGVLAFGLLQSPWKLALDIEQVEAWVQVLSLQHATVSEAQAKIAANLQYQIDNTGLKLFHILIPTNAEGVHFQGDQVADFLPVAGTVTNGLQQWEVKLHRRVIGPYVLQATYQTTMPDQAREAVVRGIQAVGVNQQRGFVTVQTGGRLQVRPDAPSGALQPAEWQSIPRALQQGLPAQAANFTYRLIDTSFDLPLKLERHEAAKLLPGRINNITFASVVSDDGIVLTRARIEMLPGDKRLLDLTLPKDSQFWFAFVNQSGVWPWRQSDRILLPLDPHCRDHKPLVVEMFYSSRAGESGTRALNLELLAPRFDLPLENLTWNVSLSDKWKLSKWSGSLQFQDEQAGPETAAVNLQTYLQNEATLQRERSKEAEQFLATGNNALDNGDPTAARRSFQAAYSLSSHDAAFNEDARVQLHNIKLQQALVGLNVRQAGVGGDVAALGPAFRDIHNRKELNYTQKDAKEIIDRNNADDNAAFMKVAERLIQQQDAAITSPAAIRASIPEQGHTLTFKRSVVVDALVGNIKVEDLKIDLRLTAARPASTTVRLLILAGTLLLLAGLARAGRAARQTS